MRLPTKKLLSKMFNMDIVNITMYADNETIVYTEYEDPEPHQMSSMPKDVLMRKMKDWIMHWEQAQGVCSHKTFYTQSDSREWYAGFSHIKTTYDDKITYKDLGKGDTEYEAVLDMAEDIIKDKK